MLVTPEGCYVAVSGLEPTLMSSNHLVALNAYSHAVHHVPTSPA